MKKYNLKTIARFVLILCLAGIFAAEASAQREGMGAAIPSIDEVVQGGAGSGIDWGKADGTTKKTASKTAGRNTAAKNSVKGGAKNTASLKNTAAAKKGGSKRVTNTAAPQNASVKNNQALLNKPYNGFIYGDEYTFMNFETVTAARPVYRQAAKNAGAKGLVQVEILIGETGRVIAARARTGSALLRPDAEVAALSTTFQRPTYYGKPARAKGFLVYRFGKAED